MSIFDYLHLWKIWKPIWLHPKWKQYPETQEKTFEILSSEKTPEKEKILPELFFWDNEVPYEAPKLYEWKDFSVWCAVDKWFLYKEVNEDWLYVDLENELFACVDWIWSYWDWAKATEIFLECMKKLPNDPGTMIDAVQKLYPENLANKWWVCFLSARIVRDGNSKHLVTNQAWDVKIVIISKSWWIKYESKDESYVQQKIDSWSMRQFGRTYYKTRHIVTNSIKHNSWNITYSLSPFLEAWDRILIMTDGITDNLLPTEIWKRIQNKTIRDSIHTIWCMTRNQMKNYKAINSNIITNDYMLYAKPDNRSIIMIDIL